MKRFFSTEAEDGAPRFNVPLPLLFKAELWHPFEHERSKGETTARVRFLVPSSTSSSSLLLALAWAAALPWLFKEETVLLEYSSSRECCLDIFLSFFLLFFNDETSISLTLTTSWTKCSVLFFALRALSCSCCMHRSCDYIAVSCAFSSRVSSRSSCSLSSAFYRSRRA